jgi:hypothetical protein
MATRVAIRVTGSARSVPASVKPSTSGNPMAIQLSMPSKDGASGCQGQPDSASAEKKKAPDIRGLVHLECSSLLAFAESGITPTRISMAELSL